MSLGSGLSVGHESPPSVPYRPRSIADQPIPTRHAPYGLHRCIGGLPQPINLVPVQRVANGGVKVAPVPPSFALRPVYRGNDIATSGKAALILLSENAVPVVRILF